MWDGEGLQVHAYHARTHTMTIRAHFTQVPTSVFYKDDRKSILNQLCLRYHVSGELRAVPSYKLYHYHVDSNTYSPVEDPSALKLHDRHIDFTRHVSLSAREHDISVHFSINKVSKNYNNLPYSMGVHVHDATDCILYTPPIVVKSKKKRARTSNTVDQHFLSLLTHVDETLQHVRSSLDQLAAQHVNNNQVCTEMLYLLQGQIAPSVQKLLEVARMRPGYSERSASPDDATPKDFADCVPPPLGHNCTRASEHALDQISTPPDTARQTARRSMRQTTRQTVRQTTRQTARRSAHHTDQRRTETPRDMSRLPAKRTCRYDNGTAPIAAAGTCSPAPHDAVPGAQSDTTRPNAGLETSRSSNSTKTASPTINARLRLANSDATNEPGMHSTQTVHPLGTMSERKFSASDYNDASECAHVTRKRRRRDSNPTATP